MTHEAYGVKWPLYQEPKTVQPKSSKPEPSLSDGALLRWPNEAMPFPYALACLDIVLLRSEEACNSYREILNKLDLPGCDSLLSDMVVALNLPKYIVGLSGGIKKRSKKNPDLKEYLESISKFVKVGFNRTIDQQNERWKVEYENAPFLLGAIILKTIADYCKVSLKDWNKYRPESNDQLMTKNQTTTPKRLEKNQLVELYKKLKWVNKHRNYQLIKAADLWYECRVNPGTIELCLNANADKYTLERSNVETEIAPCDEATGYPRKWRK